MKTETNITQKANSTLGFLRRDLKYCSEDCKRLAYIALVRSFLEYGSVVWDPYQSRDIIAIEKVQRQAARFIKMITAAFTYYDTATLRNKLTPLSIFRDLALRKRDFKKLIV